MTKSQDIARSAIYKYLSLAVDYPVEENAESLSSGVFFTETAAQLEKLPAAYQALTGKLSILQKELGGFAQLEDLQVTYTSHFDLAVNKPSFSLYESATIMPEVKAEKTAAFLADLESLYGRQGITLSDRDMPDHLATELEFMHFLCSRNQAEQQADFLARHLVNWVPQLAQSFLKHKMIPFYARLVMLIAHYVEIDHEHITPALAATSKSN
ncbi:MAG: molecular chaperone TorD family protein [Pseudomonadota bacterium]|nr:molecular chaperone TorD family protein [Pseudomonadota bacterium]